MLEINKGIVMGKRDKSILPIISALLLTQRKQCEARNAVISSLLTLCS
jgi:hypothetical protein